MRQRQARERESVRVGEEEEGIFLILSLACAHERDKGIEEVKKGSGREGVEVRFALRCKKFSPREKIEKST